MRTKIRKATHMGKLPIGNLHIPCAVLEDGTRILTQKGFLEALGRYKRPPKEPLKTDNKPSFIAAKYLEPFIPKDLERSWKPIIFKPKRAKGFQENKSYGYEAELLPKVCEIFLKARDAGGWTLKQKNPAVRCETLIRGLAPVGITALVDEATGYQETRDRQTLQTILDKCLKKKLSVWAKRFPEEFYRQMFRLKRWQWKGMSLSRPSAIGKYTTDIVFERLVPGLLKELEAKPPKNGKRTKKAKQTLWFLEAVGHPALAQHLYAVVGMMRASANWGEFHRMIERAFPK